MADPKNTSKTASATTVEEAKPTVVETPVEETEEVLSESTKAEQAAGRTSLEQHKKEAEEAQKRSSE